MQREVGMGYVRRWCVPNDHNYDRYCKYTTVSPLDGLEYLLWDKRVTICRYDKCNDGKGLRSDVTPMMSAAVSIAIIAMIHAF